MAVLATVILSGCATKPIDVNTKPIDRPAINLPPPAAVQLDKFEWVVITDKNIDGVIAKIKKSDGEVVLFALTPEGYQALSLNNEKMKTYLKQLKDQLDAYRKYYENGKR